MTITKTLSTVGVGAAIVAGSMLAVNFASAQSNKSDRQSELVSRLSTELNVDSSAVQSVFDEIKQEKMAEREAKMEEHMSTLVAEGKITQEQADALKAKKEEMQTAREALRDQDLTREEIHKQMEQTLEEFKTWAESQGIDLEAIHPKDGPDQGHGHHGRMMRGFDKPDQQ